MVSAKISKAICVTAFLLMAMPVSADYVVTGKITGQVCKGFGIKSCSFVDVDAVEGDDGRLYTMNRRYKDVSDYSASKGRCWIRTKPREGGIIGWAIGAVSGSTFYTQTANGYEKADVESITFPCRKY